MSKASQRRLAEMQKRQKTQGVGEEAAIFKLMLKGPRVILDSALVWKTVNEGPKVQKRHADDEQLAQIFEEVTPELEAIFKAGFEGKNALEFYGDDEPFIFHLPGFELTLEEMSSNEQFVITPLSLSLREFSGDLVRWYIEHLKAMGVAAGCGFWAFSSPVLYRGFLCLGATSTGASALWGYFNGAWHKARNSSVAHFFATTGSRFMAKDDPVEEHAADRLGDWVNRRAPQLLDGEESKRSLLLEIRDVFDMVQAPYLQLAMYAARAFSATDEELDDVARGEHETRKWITKRAHEDAEKRVRELQGELEAMKERELAAINEAGRLRARLSTGHQPATSVSLEDRLSVFF